MVSKSQRLVVLLLGVVVFAACAITLAKTARKPGKRSGGITVSGCLKEGNVLDRFMITGPDGKVYALRSSTIKLADHVSHSVTITGALKHDPKRDDYDFEGSEVNEEYGKGKILDPLDVEVTSLKMAGASCQ